MGRHRLQSPYHCNKSLPAFQSRQTSLLRNTQHRRHGTLSRPGCQFARSGRLVAPAPPAYSQSTTPNSSTAQQIEARAIPPISLQNDNQRHVLPPLSQLAGVQSLPIRTETTGMTNYPPQWSTPSAPTAQEMPAPPAPVYRSDLRSLADADNFGSNSVSSVASSEYRADARSASVNIDDPDVRIAAEALGDLRADFVS